MPRWVTPLFILVASGWVALLVAAPFLPTPLSAITYAFGSLICHQIPERSFHLQAYQLPVCARCFGIYAGFGAATVWAGRSVPRRVRLITALAAMPTVVTVVLEWAGVWYPSNLTRAIAGAILGGAVALALMSALHYE